MRSVPVPTMAVVMEEKRSDGRASVTWHCAFCGTTLAMTATFTNDPGMTKCPRCDKWMERAATEEAG